MRKITQFIKTGSVTALAAATLMLSGTANAEETAEPAPGAASDDAAATSRPIVAMGSVASAGVDPLKGLIRSFEGDLGPHVGRIRAFEGTIDPSKGLIRSFEGDIDPYKGLIRSFWGTLTPVAGELDPKVGRIRAFTDSFLPNSAAITAAWKNAEQTGDYTQVAQLLGQLQTSSQTQWQEEVRLRTGKGFNEAVANPFFTKWKVDLSKPFTLAGWSASDRNLFLLDWYDTVMNYSNMDRYDHWMNAVRWNPSLTQVQGGGKRYILAAIRMLITRMAQLSAA
jgi:hypothetical protein